MSIFILILLIGLFPIVLVAMPLAKLVGLASYSWLVALAPAIALLVVAFVTMIPVFTFGVLLFLLGRV